VKKEIHNSVEIGETTLKEDNFYKNKERNIMTKKLSYKKFLILFS